MCHYYILDGGKSQKNNHKNKQTIKHTYTQKTKEIKKSMKIGEKKEKVIH